MPSSRRAEVSSLRSTAVGRQRRRRHHRRWHRWLLAWPDPCRSDSGRLTLAWARTRDAVASGWAPRRTQRRPLPKLWRPRRPVAVGAAALWPAPLWGWACRRTAVPRAAEWSAVRQRLPAPGSWRRQRRRWRPLQRSTWWVTHDLWVGECVSCYSELDD